MLDSKAPKPEDIDEEDDDVPGKWHFFSFEIYSILLISFKFTAKWLTIFCQWWAHKFKLIHNDVDII